MNKKVKKITFLVLALMITLVSSTFAMTPTNGYKFSRGVSNCCYYIDSSASAYESQIVSAANNWEDTGYGWNPIYMTAVSSNYATHMDFYGRTSANYSYLGNTIVGVATYWTTDAKLIAPIGDAPKSDYFYSEIILNTNLSESYDYRTAKHEMGHAFGLDHNADNYSILFPYLSGMYVTTVQKCDHDTINYLYN